MAWALLQSASAPASGFASSKSVTYGSNLSSGTKLIACVGLASSGGITVASVKDGAGNSFALVKAQAAGSGGLENTSVWQLDTPAGDAGTKPVITATASSGTPDMSILVQEVSGLAAGTTNAAVIDGTPGAASGTGGSSTGSPAYASSVSGEYLVAVYGDDGGPETFTRPAALTLDANSVNSSSFADIGIAYGNSTGGTEAGSWALTGTSADWAVILCAFKLGAAFTPALSRPRGQAVSRASTY